jgi:hypothetical protein
MTAPPPQPADPLSAPGRATPPEQGDVLGEARQAVWSIPALASYDAEVRSALRYEKGLAIKVAVTIALVAAILIAHVYLFS